MLRTRRQARTRIRLVPVALISALLLILPTASALAADPTEAQYETAVSKAGGGAGGSAASESRLDKSVVGGLPFTGLDLIALVAVGVALASMGVALRRLTPDRTS